MGSRYHGDIAPSVERGVRKITVSAEQTVADIAVISRCPMSDASMDVATEALLLFGGCSMGLSRSFKRHMTLCDGASGAHMTII